LKSKPSKILIYEAVMRMRLMNRYQLLAVVLLLALGSISCSTPGTTTEVLSAPAAVGRGIKVYESPT
jgi:hypothetical protein